MNEIEKAKEIDRWKALDALCKKHKNSPLPLEEIRIIFGDPINTAAWWRNKYEATNAAWHKEWWAEHEERIRLEERLNIANLTIGDLCTQIQEERRERYEVRE